MDLFRYTPLTDGVSMAMQNKPRRYSDMSAPHTAANVPPQNIRQADDASDSERVPSPS